MNGATRMMVEPYVPPRARPFRLDRVRLLSGPLAEARERDRRYLHSLETGRLLHNFRTNAGLPSDAELLAGWESPDCALRGHFVGHYLSACALMYGSLGDEDLKKKASSVVSGLAECQAALGDGYLSAFPEEVFDRLEAGARVWAPWYTLHKILAGLLDMFLLCGNEQALDVAIRMASWVRSRTDRLDEAAMQRVLQVEFGGMNEALCDLYALTGEPDYLALARRFDHKQVLEPLAERRDELKGLHANTQIAKVIGAAREHELTGERCYYEAASYFWHQVVNVRSYATGGTSNYEYWREYPYRLSSRQISANDHECCCTHNMMKLTRRLFCWNPDARYGDYLERALFNGVLGTQHPKDGGAYMYYVPMRAGLFRTFCEPESSYVCCSGTGIEAFARLTDGVYYHDDEGLYVNLFVHSVLDWEERGLSIRQETSFPLEEGTTLILKTEKPQEMRVRIRIPYWVSHGVEVRVNGQRLRQIPLPCSFVEVDRTWQDGDRIQVRLPMGLHLSRLQNEPSMAAIMYGPLVLAGSLGTENMTPEMEQGMGRSVYPESRDGAAAAAPAFITDETDLRDWIRPVDGQPLTFRTVGAGVPYDVTLKPFCTVFGERYGVYWNIHRSDEWQMLELERPALPEGVLDEVTICDDRSDYDHNFQAYRYEHGELQGRKWVRTPLLLRYDLNVSPEDPACLQVTYFGDDADCDFEIRIDGRKLDVEPFSAARPGEFFEEVYPIPVEMTSGRRRVAVMFRVAPEKEQAAASGTGTAASSKPVQRVTPRIFGCAILGEEASPRQEARTPALGAGKHTS